MSYNYIRILLLLIVIAPLHISHAQINKSPADSGIIQWGHQDFAHYSYPSMCDRAGQELIRLEFRSLEAISKESSNKNKALSSDSKALIEGCLAGYSLDSLEGRNLWGYIRGSLLLDRDDWAKAGIEKAISNAIDSSMKIDMYETAIKAFLSNSPRRLDLVEEYLLRLDRLNDTPIAASISMRNLLIKHWRSENNSDSVHRYAIEAIDIMKSMSNEVKDEVNAMYPYWQLIELANESSNLLLQQDWLDSLKLHLVDWAVGEKAQQIANLQRLIDFRKSLYGRRTNPITDGTWFNISEGRWPADKKVSLLVLVDHLCSRASCLNRYRTIRDIKAAFGDDLHVTLVTPSSGYSIGTYTLSLQEEGDSIVSLFTNSYGMPYSVLLDPRPTARLPDGRIVFGVGPVAEMFQEWRGTNAILTDKEGRVRWMGTFNGDEDKLRVLSTIRATLSF